MVADGDLFKLGPWAGRVSHKTQASRRPPITGQCRHRRSHDMGRRSASAAPPTPALGTMPACRAAPASPLDSLGSHRPGRQARPLATLQADLTSPSTGEGQIQPCAAQGASVGSCAAALLESPASAENTNTLSCWRAALQKPGGTRRDTPKFNSNSQFTRSGGSCT
jgi:hypothetical protein